MASETEWFGGGNASAFVGTDATGQNDSTIDLGGSTLDDAFGALGGVGEILGAGITADTDGGVADDFSLNPETPYAGGLTDVAGAGGDALYENFTANGDDSTLGLDDMFGSAAFGASDVIADDVLEETPTSEAAATSGLANPFIEADYEHEVVKFRIAYMQFRH